MLRQEDKDYEKRHNLLKMFREQDISYSTRVALTNPMAGLTESEKEEIAEQLLNAIKDCNTEEEMLLKASLLNFEK